MLREAVVAGTFYERDKTRLLKSIEECFLNELGPGSLPAPGSTRAGRVLGLVCPHAGYIYSGAAAAHAYHALASDGLPDTIALLGPNHTGLGAEAAVCAYTQWSTPLGAIDVDAETAEAILRVSKYASSDNLAHAREHSIEVQLPFLQYLGSEAKIVPISIAHLSLNDAIALASDLGSAIGKALQGKSAVVIASTDLTHYESKSTAQAQDELAMAQILKLDPAGLLRVVYGKSISMCGVIGTAVMIQACKELGATKAKKLAYYTSGDVTGDTRQVVGYGALKLEK